MKKAGFETGLLYFLRSIFLQENQKNLRGTRMTTWDNYTMIIRFGVA
jgi:hypothetical protein